MVHQITAEAIQKAMESPIAVEVLESVDSTNTEAKRRISAGLTAPLLLLAKAQTAGRGRLGRAFCSPQGAGLYMSLVLHPNCPPSQVISITSAAAVAVALAIEDLTHLRPQIKWVNDVYIGDKKVCGILTEGVTDPQSGLLQSIVVGIGINCTPAAFPSDVAAIATSLAGEGAAVEPNHLAAAVCDRLWQLYKELSTKTWLPLYRERSWLDGREVVYRTGDTLRKGTVLGIGEEGELLLSTEAGDVELSTGEVSVRPIERAEELF
ncbi:MAG: biotin--[acetyl-CoA-carboxylase] ligase [Clostridia bacterium]|nr:biotin--[acetyl-CoA-carboxylase] ligase [Clostridia bacterium]